LREKVVVLEDETDLGIAETGEVIRIEGGGIFSGNGYFSSRGAVECSKAIEESAFA